MLLAILIIKFNPHVCFSKGAVKVAFKSTYPTTSTCDTAFMWKVPADCWCASAARQPAVLCCWLLLLQVKRVEELRTDISRLELSITSAKAEYEKIKAANLTETARFAAERRAEYSLMLENFTAIQVGRCNSLSTTPCGLHYCGTCQTHQALLAGAVCAGDGCCRISRACGWCAGASWMGSA